MTDKIKILDDGRAVLVRLPEVCGKTISTCFRADCCQFIYNKALQDHIEFESRNQVKEVFGHYLPAKTLIELPKGWKVEVKEQCEYLCDQNTCLSFDAQYDKTKCKNNKKLARLIPEEKEERKN